MTQVLLLSGGVESATLLWMEAAKDRPQPVFADYGQRAARREQQSAEAQCAALGLGLKVLDLASLGTSFRAGQSKQMHVPLPHRNLVILGVALSYATQVEADSVLLALNREDTQAYPSATPAFIERFQAMADVLGGIRIHTPLIELSKAEIIRQGAALGMDYTNTYSCLLGYERHCGRCPQCLKRQAAFLGAQVLEPTDFYQRPQTL